jgi:hypothetical protein
MLYTGTITDIRKLIFIYILFMVMNLFVDALFNNPYVGALKPSVLKLRFLQLYVPLRAESSASVPALDY